ncbi:IAA acetyltransferase, variant [Blastomyces dermatitidis ER-3]|uniref:IAA acetyltransferase n=1 Tax=Ajellomyces dermatitidis (strain ER-3 / ATCC MYA-2586) TaxID=559297 RepID=A0ABX2VSQ9_AJEDR|nr:IAA acetyltransferase [Blastomyces dermatitidis ER-3]XP_045279975.1 IAA acetyltransferase, variant [Blastomyces dermatitidis ER-3]EQL35245.1 hypothetical protein BDFG_03000 [Blastomyces dermatitidis ATCC 26199]EQL35246.1 hypothetical protein, variant [Blastomyces dermatitidis ATCC 26199]OAT00247.1 IAA acetyltransferase [Blastomyces dermatitidis ER-3]OAT00248.1 IAA acetyltransferase, variant [Blastomyces dermatitidis ER-3]
MLRHAQRSELAVRYNTPDSEYGPKPTKDDITTFIVAYIDAKPVGCGALRALSNVDDNNNTTVIGDGPQIQTQSQSQPPPPLLPAEAEVKCMFVVPEFRGKRLGIASVILEALHERAQSPEVAEAGV